MDASKFHFKHVLLIDDSEIDILVNRRLMELTFFASQITIAGSGEEALEFFRHECRSADEAPDLIFLDMYLPMMSGYDFIEEFKKLPEYVTNKTKIIILSVFQKQEHLDKALENHFVAGQLEKPLSRQSLSALAQKRIANFNPSV